MSSLQNEAKPFLIPLITGNSFELNETGQAILSSWATMFTMVAEFADPRTVGISAGQRASLRDERSPPAGWAVWIGRYAGSRWSACFAHTGIALGSTEIDFMKTPSCNIQFTTFAIGQVIFHVVSSSIPELSTVLPDIIPHYGMRSIFPASGTLTISNHSISDGDVENIRYMFKKLLHDDIHDAARGNAASEGS